MACLVSVCLKLKVNRYTATNRQVRPVMRDQFYLIGLSRPKCGRKLRSLGTVCPLQKELLTVGALQESLP